MCLELKAEKGTPSNMLRGLLLFILNIYDLHLTE